MDTESALMNMIVDEKKVVTAVTLSRKLNIWTIDASKAMVDFYEHYRDKIDDLWATFLVSGSREKFGVPIRSSVLCRENDLDKVKAQFKTVTMKLFSLQTVKIEDLNSLLAGDRLDDYKFFRSDAERNIGCCKIAKQFAEELRAKVQSGNSDVLIAMRYLLANELNHKSPEKSATTCHTIKKIEKTQKMDTLFKKACERQKTPKSTPKKEAKTSPWSEEKSESALQSSEESVDSTDVPSHIDRSAQIKIDVDDEDSPVKAVSKAVKKNLSSKFSSTFPKTKKLNKDIFDDEDSSPEKLKEQKEKSPEHLPEKKTDTKRRKRSPAPSEAPKEEESSQESEDSQGNTVSSDAEQVPAKKRKMVKTVETYQDEDGFLVTKEVVHMVDTDEPEETHSKPLRPANNIKAPHHVHNKKKSAAAGTQKISAFFTKK